jgi:hypothetical protein
MFSYINTNLRYTKSVKIGRLNILFRFQNVKKKYFPFKINLINKKKISLL